MVDKVRRSVTPRDGGKTYGIGKDWRPDHPDEEVFHAWWLWRQSGRTRYYSREEAAALPRDWIEDIHLIESIAEWVSNDSVVMSNFAQHMAKNGNKNDR